MFRFANIDMLWLLLLVPLLAGVYIYLTRRKRRQLRSLGDEELVSRLMPDASHFGKCPSASRRENGNRQTSRH